MKYKKLINLVIIIAALCASAFAEDANGDRFGGRVALQKSAPHEVAKVYSLGNDVVVVVVIPKRTTNAQLKLIADWYVSQANAKFIFFFNDMADALNPRAEPVVFYERGGGFMK